MKQSKNKGASLDEQAKYTDWGEKVEIQNELDIAYESYKRVYLWDLDEPLSKEKFKERLQIDEDFRKVWGI